MFSNDDFSENQLTKFSAIEIIRTNKGGVTNLNVGILIICERSEQKIFCTPRFVQLLMELFWGGGVKADPSDKFQLGGRPPALANRTLGRGK